VGMFDWVRCEYPLPDHPRMQRCTFQTKDLDNCLDMVTIMEDGTLSRIPVAAGEWGADLPRDVDVAAFSGSIRFYTNTEACAGRDWIEFNAVFINGRLKTLTEQNEVEDLI
jgi:hypothetical protein